MSVLYKDGGTWVERKDERDVPLVETEELEVNEVVGDANFELDRFPLNLGMEERFLTGVDAGDGGMEDEDGFGEPDPYGGVVRSKEVSTSVSCKLSSELPLREPLEEQDDEVSGRES